MAARAACARRGRRAHITSREADAMTDAEDVAGQLAQVVARAAELIVAAPLGRLERRARRAQARRDALRTLMAAVQAHQVAVELAWVAFAAGRA